MRGVDEEISPLRGREPRPRVRSRRSSKVSLAEEILEQISEGVLVLDGRLRPTVVNGVAREMLGLQREALPRRLPSDELIRIAREAQTGDVVDRSVEVWFPRKRSLMVRGRLIDESMVLLTVRDVTEEVLAQRIRREFVAHASHELKTPVAGLETLAGAILHALKDDPDAAARFSEQMVVEADRLGRLVADLLDLSQLEEAVRVTNEVVDVSELMRKELEDASTTSEAKALTFKFKLASGVCIRGDAQQITVLVRNLLDNAIRYTPKGGSVGSKLFRRNDRVVISVSDTGIGIPLEAQPRIFERFFRVDRARSRDRGGTGLGLAIVKHAAELHGGAVRVESELGRGSTFTVTLPAIGPEARAEETKE